MWRLRRRHQREHHNGRDDVGNERDDVAAGAIGDCCPVARGSSTDQISFQRKTLEQPEIRQALRGMDKRSKELMAMIGKLPIVLVSGLLVLGVSALAADEHHPAGEAPSGMMSAPSQMPMGQMPMGGMMGGAGQP